MAGPVTDPTVARRAKEALREAFEKRSWFRGVGLVPMETGYALRLNVDPSAELEREEIPGEVLGIPVEVVLIAGYSAR